MYLKEFVKQIIVMKMEVVDFLRYLQILQENDVVPEFNWDDFNNFNFTSMTHLYIIMRQDREIVDLFKEAIRNRNRELANLIMADSSWRIMAEDSGSSEGSGSTGDSESGDFESSEDYGSSEDSESSEDSGSTEDSESSEDSECEKDEEDGNNSFYTIAFYNTNVVSYSELKIYKTF
ncbi:hypothetical protein DMENIID0001_155360 [Sergentomyia squamirostris]